MARARIEIEIRAPERGALMHFIEQLLGSSPDGGSGLTELLLIMLPLAASAMAAICIRPICTRRK